jgi:hypothetical protein
MTTSFPIDPASPLFIQSNRLKVEIAQPGTVYNRTRFDWTGFITQVTLDGKHTFCVPEDYDPQKGTGGIGLCSEFGNEKCIGYADAQPGEAFPKLGIGLLKKNDRAAYNFFQPYEILEPFKIHVETGEDRTRFTVDPLDCRGYAVREIKMVSVQGNCLQIDYALENTGRLPIDTHEYVHNFTAIDQHPVGPGYRLRFPYPVRFEQFHESYRSFLPPLLQKVTPGFVLKSLVQSMMNTDVLLVEGQEVRWKGTPQKAFYCRPAGFSQTDQPQWELVLEAEGAGVREIDDFAPSRVALWGAAHVISAEVYLDVHLMPVQTQSWTRRYEFFSAG